MLSPQCSLDFCVCAHRYTRFLIGKQAYEHRDKARYSHKWKTFTESCLAEVSRVLVKIVRGEKS